MHPNNECTETVCHLLFEETNVQQMDSNELEWIKNGAMDEHYKFLHTKKEQRPS